MSKKQDRTFVRTAAQLKRELSAGRRLNEAFDAIDDTQGQVEKLESELPEGWEDFKAFVIADVRAITNETVVTARNAKEIAETVVEGESGRAAAEEERAAAEALRVQVTEALLVGLDDLLAIQESYIIGDAALAAADELIETQEGYISGGNL